MRKRTFASLLSLWAFACVHPPPGTRRLGEQQQLTVVDTLPPLLAALQSPDAGDVASSARALLAYEGQIASLLDGAGVARPTADPRLTRLAVSREALASVLEGFERRVWIKRDASRPAGFRAIEVPEEVKSRFAA